MSLFDFLDWTTYIEESSTQPQSEDVTYPSTRKPSTDNLLPTSTIIQDVLTLSAPVNVAAPTMKWDELVKIAQFLSNQMEKKTGNCKLLNFLKF